jgi:hypothetical protein
VGGIAEPQIVEIIGAPASTPRSSISSNELRPARRSSW